jgi:hypothetical protein
MLRKTLSAITAIVIGTSGISAEAMDKSVSVSINPDAKKSVIVVPTGNPTQPIVVNNPVQTQSTGGVYNLNPTPRQVIQPATSSRGYSDTIVYASGAKNSYQKNEPIHIRLKLKRKAFIYFWTISANGKGYLILPNDLESFNRYRANVNYVVPERSADYDFVSDRAGVEQVYVLATNKKINANKIESIFKNRQASNKSIRKFITKDIKVIARNKNLKYDIASFQIQVHDQSQTPSNVNITINQ